MTDTKPSAEAHHDEIFRSSFPQPPASPPGGKVLIWRGPGGQPSGESDDILLWQVPSSLARRFRGAASARNYTLSQHLSALVSLHEEMRQRADSGDEQAAALLAQLGLSTVSI